MLFVGLATVIVAMGVTWMVTPGIIWLGHALGAVDLPGGRKVHSEPIPRIGGLAVFAGFIASLTFAAWVTDNLGTVPQASVYWRGLAIAAAGMLIVGLIDDLVGLSFYWKFAAQILAASYIWSCGFRVEMLSHPMGGSFELGVFSFPLTVLWVVGITNAVNLIDGLDGLATGIALITTTTVAVIAFLRAELGVTAASVALAGSLIGFLRFNLNPARIFLGDSGSMFLGFVLAVTAARGSQKGPTIVAILVPLLVLGLPVLDTGLAVIRRLYRLGSQGARTNGSIRYVVRNFNHVFLPDRGHIHHRLLELGLSHRRAVLVLHGVGLLFALCAFALVMVQSLWLAICLVSVLVLMMAAFLALVYFGIRSRRPEATVDADDPPTGRPQGKAVAGSPRPQPQSR